jgi:isocitrate dehydrogenase (NAD+)
MHRITFIPGDGIGPEIMEVMRKIVDATGVDIEWDVQICGEEAIEKYGTPLPNEAIESIKRNKVAIKGPLTTPVGMGYRSINVEIRKRLDLYACIRPCKLYPGVPSRYEDVDIVVFRENLEGLYSAIEFEVGKDDTHYIIEEINRLSNANITKDSALAIKKISIFNSRRIVRAAFEYARRYNRKKVTAVHKANILKHADGLFLRVAREVAEQYPDIEFNDMMIDNAAMQLVKNPERFDIIVTMNLYGDIISDLCAGLVGGLGLAPSGNIGDNYAVFEATHGSAPKYKGMNKVNPSAIILSAVMMLRHIGEDNAADLIEKALSIVIKEGKYLTYDLKPKTKPVGTREFGEAILSVINKLK